MKKIKMTQLAVALMFVTLGLTVPYALGVAHALTTISFGLVPVATCLQDATGAVTVLHKEDTLGVDTLHLDARGLPADTDFAVFLTSADAFATPTPFGTAEYIVGLNFSMVSKIVSGVGRRSSSTAVLPVHSGKVMELPRP